MMSSRFQEGTLPSRQFTAGGAWTGPLQVTATVAGLVVLAGLLVAPGRTWPSVLIAGMYLVGLSLAGMLFLAFHYLVTAGWSVCVKRVAEALASTLPLAALAILLCLAGITVLYEWSHAEAVSGNALLQAKAAWLNVPFFVVRTVVYLAVWLIFCGAMLRTSRRQDRTGGLQANRRSTFLSAGFMAVFAVTFSLASFDWLMSLEPEWYSTIFAAYHFAGAFVSGLAVISIAAILLRRHGALAGIFTSHHLHDLGKLLMGFTTFWVYMWFCQFMLIWYGNLPEEATFYQWRHQGAWAVLSVANLLANWVIPFLVLLPRPAKHDENRMLRVCALLLVGHWLDLYVSVQPAFERFAPVLGLWELAPPVAAGALFLLFFRRALSAADLVPRGDPYLAESLRHHQ
jgi:hypothetical protein